jgi:hypothetical protein
MERACLDTESQHVVVARIEEDIVNATDPGRVGECDDRSPFQLIRAHPAFSMFSLNPLTSGAERRRVGEHPCRRYHVQVTYQRATAAPPLGHHATSRPPSEGKSARHARVIWLAGVR